MTSPVPSLIASLFSMLMTQFIHTGDVKALMHRGEKCIAKVKLYFNMNSLLLNANKTQYMFVVAVLTITYQECVTSTSTL